MVADNTPAEEVEGVDPLLELAETRFLATVTEDAGSKQAHIDALLKDIEENDRAALYEQVAAALGLILDEAKLQSMREKNVAELKTLDEKIKDAEENLGETEVREAYLAKAEYYKRLGDKQKALEQFEATEKKTVAVGQKMDLVFSTLRLGLFYLDFDLLSKHMQKQKDLFNEGGDWERKNRLKVYEAVTLMATRKFKEAAELFLDSISTFTTNELMSYNTFIFYTVLTALTSLDRPVLKAKVVDAPEVLAVIKEIPKLSELLYSFYNCDYGEFFRAFAEVSDAVKMDRYLHLHYRYFMREARIVAYTQFLESYKSVTLQSMAQAFGISDDLLDKELSRFIAVGRLNCKIDKVAGVVETNRPDAKNALYQNTIKEGDMLLNRIQKLSRVIVL